MSATHSEHALRFRPEAFKANAHQVLRDTEARESFRGAMHFLVERRAMHFWDLQSYEALRTSGEAIRQHALTHLPELLETLERRLQALGVHVHWAETPADANRIFLDIARRHEASLMVKGKSMVSEEIALNDEMARHDIECVETDIGEYILQLDHDRPSHIIMPALHKSREQVAGIFHEHIPDAPLTDDVGEMIAIGRRALRGKFAKARIGVSGVNFMVAETGSLVLVENEGNGRFCTSVPDVHIAVTGIEKVVEKLEHVPPLYALLTRSATGQAVTTYLNFLTGPRRPGERDGPREMHLVLLDNGRTQAYREPDYRSTLQCIRCGACMNHCPVYTRVGGRAYGTTYPGPLGAIISPHLMGLEATRDLPTASSLCGACGDVCPVRIPIPELLTRLREAARNEAQDTLSPPTAQLREQGRARRRIEALAWTGWRLLYATPWLYRIFARLAPRLRWMTPAWQGGWTRSRAPLRPARRSCREMLGNTVRKER
ncbi:lactate utilization protein B [Algiphilus sp.]|uniref:lactate utilization protein B n=1 Tax=Algiphilus sp. TaxID=1872431 RepID=UPI003C42F948